MHSHVHPAVQSGARRREELAHEGLDVIVPFPGIIDLILCESIEPLLELVGCVLVRTQVAAALGVGELVVVSELGNSSSHSHFFGKAYLHVDEIGSWLFSKRSQELARVCLILVAPAEGITATGLPYEGTYRSYYVKDAPIWRGFKYGLNKR